MPPDRITNAIDNLVSHLVPRNPEDDDAAAQERHDNCFELVKTYIDRYFN